MQQANSVLLMDEGFQVEAPDGKKFDFVASLEYRPDEQGGQIWLGIDVQHSDASGHVLHIQKPLRRPVPDSLASKLLLGILARP